MIPATPPPFGSLAEWDFPALLLHYYRRDGNGRLLVSDQDWQREIFLENGRIRFCRSSRIEDRLDNFLRRQGALPEEPIEMSLGIMKTRSCRQGRALMELGIMSPGMLWQQVRSQLRHILFSLFPLSAGHFHFDCQGFGEENILLEDHPLSLIAAGIRRLENDALISSRIQSCLEFRTAESDPEKTRWLEDHEMYVLDLVGRWRGREEVIEKSELLPIDTRKIIYLLLRLGLITDQREVLPANCGETEKTAAVTPGNFAFTSFEEALLHYNRRFRLIYKSLLKELGPIAGSILEKAISEVAPGLHNAFRHARLNEEGELERNSLLNNFWYSDFQSNIGDFLRGLEEIMYAEIFAVKNHLGREYEQQVIKWIRETGN